MYQSFYGLRELPFELTPNPKYLFLTTQHREALTTLEYGLSTAKAVTALIGEAGTGKTTLLHAALESERCRHVGTVYVNNPALTRSEFIEMLSMRFDLSVHARSSKAALLEELARVLRERRARGQITALVVDEAQSLSGELLEEIRLLANIETTTEKLLPLVLAGQPELTARLNEPGLRQLKQRVTLRCTINPFGVQETAAYIAQRIRTAGGDAARLFTRDAVLLIHERSGGIPRMISVMCDNALLTACGLGRQPVDTAIVLEVARDFDLRSTGMYYSPTGLHSVEDVDERVEEVPNESDESRVSEVSLVPAVAPTPVEDSEAEDDRRMFAETAAPRRFSIFGRG